MKTKTVTCDFCGKTEDLRSEYWERRNFVGLPYHWAEIGDHEFCPDCIDNVIETFRKKATEKKSAPVQAEETGSGSPGSGSTRRNNLFKFLRGER